MFGKGFGRADRWREAAAIAGPGRPMRAGGPGITVAMLLFSFLLQPIESQAELLFRSGAQGQQQWSALRNYATPSDTAHLRGLADGTQAAAEEVQVFVHGYITSADVYGARVMESLLKNGRQKITGNVVSFASNGGEVEAAMELGRVLRRLGVSAVVAEGDQCLSSCVFAFMGGDRRTVAGRIGVHRPYFTSARDVPDRRVHYRHLQKKLQEFIDELDFPQSLYEAVMAVPPQLVNILTSVELKKFYLEGMSPAAEDEADAASARGLGISVVEYLQRKAQGLPCADVLSAAIRCAAGAPRTAGSGAVAEAPARPQDGETASANPAVGRAAESEQRGR